MQGVNNAAGEEITEPEEWCKTFAENYYAEAKEAYDGATDAERQQIDKMLGSADSMASKGNLQSHISDLQDEEDFADIMNGMKAAFPGAF